MGVKTFFDQCGNRVEFNSPPKKIISLVPSQTELLADLSLDNQVVGITEYCVHPTHWQHSKKIIGGTKKFDLQAIHMLHPDLIIGNKEENYKEGIFELQLRYPVWLSDIYSLDDSFSMIQSIGAMTDRQIEASDIVGRIRDAFLDLQRVKSQSILYLIWRKPWMAAATNTFIDHILDRCGLLNCIRHFKRYPMLTEGEIADLKPDLVFLSSEPYPFKEKHIRELQDITPLSRIFLVDGEMFSWYGSRLLKVPAYLNALTSRLR